MGIEVNEKIIEHFMGYMKNNPDAPKSLLNIIKECLKIESGNSSLDKKGLHKLYSSLFESYVKDNQLLDWCKNYGKQ